MKLIRLKIEERFRSLKNDFEIVFRKPIKSDDLFEFHPFCFAGLNGSGKSNVLEALSNIFYHLECIINNYPVFAYEAKESNPNTFELEYFIGEEDGLNTLETLNHVFIKKNENETPEISVNKGEFIKISKDFGRSFMPDLIVAYSSGENETISLPYIKMKLFQYDQYIKDLKEKVVFKKPESSLLYIDYEMSQAVLLTILIFFDFEKDDQDGVLALLKKEIKITGIQEFTINLNNHWQAIVNDGQKDNHLIEVESIVNRGEDKDKIYIGRILDNIQDYLNKLKDCATCSNDNGNYTEMSFLVDENIIKLIRQKFDNDPYKFFSIFQTLHSLNARVEENIHKYEVYSSKGYYTDYKRPEYSHFFYFTHYKVKKIGEENEINKLLLRQLSDGEQQFLHTLGICLMLKNKRTLLLLDEPETHFNPDWRSKFIDILRKTLKAGNDNFLLKEIVLTSHSPFIISDCFPDKVIIFKKGQQPTIPDFNTFGTSIGLITSKIFNNNQTIGNFSNDEIQKFERIFEEKNYNEALQILNSKIGDSVEKLLFINRMKNKHKE